MPNPNTFPPLTTHAGGESSSDFVRLRIAAVVVTYNRKALLAECLDALLQQSRPLDAIFLIDQASTDGTPEMLQERGYLQKEKIHFQRAETNTGGAGGFHRGMQSAQDAGYDWIWVMDDDAIPDARALEESLPYTQHTSAAAISNCEKFQDGVSYGQNFDPWPESTEAPPYRRLVSSTFVGLLIRGTAIATIGLPRKEFFIHYDDLEYCIRLRKIGDIAFAEKAIIVHKQGHVAYARKKRFGFTFESASMKQQCFLFFDYRNIVWVRKNYLSFFQALAVITQMYGVFMLKALLLEREHNYLRGAMITKAFYDGLTNRFDNDYPFRILKRLHLL